MCVSMGRAIDSLVLVGLPPARQLHTLCCVCVCVHARGRSFCTCVHLSKAEPAAPVCNVTDWPQLPQMLSCSLKKDGET